MRQTIRIGIIGYGYWGPNLVRNFCGVKGSQVVAVADRRLDRLDLVRQRFPAVTTTQDARELIEPSEKIKIYDCAALFTEGPDVEHQSRVSYRRGDVWAPHLDMTEGLQIEAAHFLDCIRTGTRPQTDGWSGLRVVQILEAAERSMHQNGAPVALDWGEEVA